MCIKAVDVVNESLEVLSGSATSSGDRYYFSFLVNMLVILAAAVTYGGEKVQ